MLFEELLIYITIPFASVFVRGSLQKWGITNKMLESQYDPIYNLGFCALCFYTWCNFLCSLGYASVSKDYYFLLFTPAFTIISLIISDHLNVFDNGE